MMGFHYHRGLDAGDITLEGHMIRLHLRAIAAAGGGVVDPMKLRDDYMKFMEEGSHGDTWVSCCKEAVTKLKPSVVDRVPLKDLLRMRLYLYIYIYIRFLSVHLYKFYQADSRREPAPVLGRRRSLRNVRRSASTTALSIVAWKGDGPWTNAEGASQTPWMY